MDATNFSLAWTEIVTIFFTTGNFANNAFSATWSSFFLISLVDTVGNSIYVGPTAGRGGNLPEVLGVLPSTSTCPVTGTRPTDAIRKDVACRKTGKIVGANGEARGKGPLLTSTKTGAKE